MNKEKNFMALSHEYASKDSKYCVVKVPWEKDTTYGSGASKGPSAIIDSSQHLEYFDSDLEFEVFDKGIELKKIFFHKELNSDQAIEEINTQLSLFNDKFSVFLGGDHSITIGTVKHFENNHDFDVVVFDAHADFRYSWNQSENNHACVNRRLINNHNVLIIGVRSFDVDEFKEMKNNDKINFIKCKDITLKSLRKELSKLKKKVYVSIDVDVFDPAFIRNTGTPEPGGVFWDDLCEMLKIVFNEKEVVSADVVEFSPKQNFESEAYALAKLTHKLFVLKEKYN